MRYDSTHDNDTFYDGAVDDSVPPLDRMVPNSRHHQWVLDQLLKRIRASEDAIGTLYDRWRVAERKVQAYINLPKYERILQQMNRSGLPPAPQLIVFPYQYAVQSTIVTYLARVICGRKPIFPLATTSAGEAELVQSMETILQYQADMQKLIMKLIQFFNDGEQYGLCILRNTWETRKAMRTKFTKPSSFESGLGIAQPVRTRELRTVYEGGRVENVDPFMFFPDPNVPMAEVAEKGEFVGWRQFVNRNVMLDAQRNGLLKWVDTISASRTAAGEKWTILSNRNLLSEGTANAGEGRNRYSSQLPAQIMEDQISIMIIPDDWGLGEETYPCRVLFTIANKQQIVGFELLDYDHDAHPVVVAEPYTQGYGFGQPSIADYLGPIQDVMSWFIDSHIQNVRAVLNDSLIYDPSRIEAADLKRTGPGRLIRLKPSAIGQDVRTAISQLQIQDVTQAHMGDLQQFMRIGDTISSVNDNMRGQQQNTSGRRSATEVRMSGEAGASRLAKHAQVYSSQAITELARQMTMNTQQFMTQEIYLKVLGAEKAQRFSPDMLVGDFVFPVSDGTLPYDKVALLDVWKELYLALKDDPQMRTTYSLPRVFEYIAELGGASNIQSFRMDLQANPAQNPNMVPLREVVSNPPGGNPALGTPRQQTPLARPMQRLAA